MGRVGHRVASRCASSSSRRPHRGSSRSIRPRGQEGDADLLDPHRSAAPIWFQDKAHRPPRNRIHVDVSVPHDQAMTRVAAILVPVPVLECTCCLPAAA
jgi:hypothetical protein